MSIDISITIIFISLIQSIFGTGVLLFGTPILLILGYDFKSLLIILLPISISINIIQIKDGLENIDVKFYKGLIIYCLPSVFIALYLIDFNSKELHLFVGLFLTMISLKSNIKVVGKLLVFLFRNETIYLILMGLLHGITNLGGALLSGGILIKESSKDVKRATIAICYLSMAFIQIFTLVFKFNSNTFIASFNPIYLITALAIYITSQRFLYDKISDHLFVKISDIFLFMMGFTLVGQYLLN